jgi:uncharacterized protein with PIN domain
MNIYAESSAVLAWLLGEPGSDSVREVLRRAEVVLSSDLTLVECDRVLIRGMALGEINEGAAADRRARLNAAAAHWQVLRINSDFLERARRPFPAEPVRTLHAVHLASALWVRSVVPEVQLLSLDQRVRRSAMELGFNVQPE